MFQGCFMNYSGADLIYAILLFHFSIISVMTVVKPVPYTARRRMLYANFLMSDRVFRDFLAGDRSSLNVSSST